MLWLQESLAEQGRVLLDPNRWSADGTTALAGISPSDDGRWLAYGIQESGSDWRNWRILDLNTGATLAEQLQWIKFGGIAWTADSEGFFTVAIERPRRAPRSNN